MAGASRKNGHIGVQLTIRDCLSLDPTDALKIALTESIKNCSLSRAQVVETINRLASAAGINQGSQGVRITEDVLNKWCARGSTGHQIPVKYIPIFCQTTGSTLAIEALLPPGSQVIKGNDVAMLQWARAERERRNLTRQSRKLAQEAGIE